MSSHRADDASTPGDAWSIADLPSLWRGRSDYVVFDADFAHGERFMAAWAAWQQDASRCDRLWYLSCRAPMPDRAELARLHAQAELSVSLHAHAAALRQAWPPATPDLHSLHFDHGKVRLLLHGSAALTALRNTIARIDLYLWRPGVRTSHAAAAVPADADLRRQIAQPCARLAADHALAVLPVNAAPWRDAFISAGFADDTSIAQNGHALRYAPRKAAAVPPGRAPAWPAGDAVRSALVVGAGLAGASVAAALAQLGVAVQVLERHDAPAAEASGNAAGLYHGTVHAADGTYARLLRTAALRVAQVQRDLPCLPATAGAAQSSAAAADKKAGLLRLDTTCAAAMHSRSQSAPMPTDWVQVLDRDTAAQHSGVSVPHAAWLYPCGGWLEPIALVRHWLAQQRVQCTTGASVASLRRCGNVWQALDDTGACVAEAGVVVLAGGLDAARLAATALDAPPPWGALRRQRGQITQVPGGTAGLAIPALPLVGDGYAIPLPRRLGGGVLCGATSHDDDDDASLRTTDHAANLARLVALTGSQPMIDPATLPGRVGWRLHTDDRLPLLGPLAPSTDATARMLPPRRRPRVAGVYVYTALGSRGITWAPLLGEVLAAWITGAPVPLPARLLDALDVARLA